MIHGHGDDLYLSGDKVVANFSTNVWYGADMAPLRALLAEKTDVMLHYPEPDACSFGRVAAIYHGVPPASVLVGNGATELFYLIAHAFAGGHTLLPVPSFKEYEDACSLYNHQLDFVRETDVENIPETTGLMFICNPNNPDGRMWSLKEITALLENNPDMTLVVDESFIHFAPEAHSACALLSRYPNLLVIRSMTKSYAIPGLRLGYMLGEPALVEYIACFKQPWTVNAFAIEIGKYLLQQGEGSLPDAALLLERAKRFASQIAAIPGFYPIPSQTSFFLIRTDHDSGHLKRYLLEEHGVLVRDASNFRGLDNHYFRVNTLTDDKNGLLVRALKNVALGKI